MKQHKFMQKIFKKLMEENYDIVKNIIYNKNGLQVTLLNNKGFFIPTSIYDTLNKNNYIYVKSTMYGLYDPKSDYYKYNSVNNLLQKYIIL